MLSRVPCCDSSFSKNSFGTNITCKQGSRVGVGGAGRRRFLGGVGVGFLTRLEVRFFIPLRKSNLIIFLLHTPKLGISVEIVQFFMKLLLKQRILAVYHDFDCV